MSRPSAEALREATLALVRERGPGRTACPSEVARRMDPQRWRELMPAVRSAAGELAAAGRIEVTRKGRRVDPAAARGPIRLGLPEAQDSE